MSETKSISGAYAKIDKHEAVCAERYQTTLGRLQDLKDGHTELTASNKSQTRMLLGILFAVVGWLAVQLWAVVAPEPSSPVHYAARLTQ